MNTLVISKTQHELLVDIHRAVIPEKAAHCTCDAFKKAMLSCTDSEGYGPLIRKWDAEFRIGCDLPPMNFCPWCGKPVPEKP